MAVTIATRIRTARGQGEALVEAVADHFTRSVRHRSDCELSYLFQDLEDADKFLHVVVWSTPEQQAANVQVLALPPLDALLAAPPRTHRAAQIESYERVGHRIGALGCAIVTVSPHAARDAGAVLTALAHAHLRDGAVVEAGSALEAGPAVSGLVLYRLYQDLDAPGTWTLVHCWEHAEALLAFRARKARILTRMAEELGAEVERFVGVPRAVLSRHFPG